MRQRLGLQLEVTSSSKVILIRSRYIDHKVGRHFLWYGYLKSVIVIEISPLGL
jgi:hypothetical protein